MQKTKDGGAAAVGFVFSDLCEGIGGLGVACRGGKDAVPGKAKPLLSNHVSKKGPGVYALSIAMPGGKCPFASGICSKYCYASRGRFRWNSRCYERNLEASQDAGFVERVCGELRAAAGKNPGAKIACAIHEKGDFYTLDYLRKWGEVIRAMAAVPNLSFFLYTRAWISAPFRQELERIGAGRNVQINLSTDREMLAGRGMPSRIGGGIITYLAETDDDVPAHPVDLVFRNLVNRPTSPLERIGGRLVCPHESNMFAAMAGGTPVLEDGRMIRIRCQECRICIDRAPADWERVKGGYAGTPG